MKKQLKVIMAGTTVFWGASIFNDPVQAIVLEKVPTTQTSSEKEHEDFSIYQDKIESKDVDGNLTTVGEVAEDQNKHNALGVAGMFNIFSKETNISADTNGNVATKTYHSGNEFGARGKSHNLTATKDVNYIEKIEDIGANGFRAQDQTVVVGKDSDNVQKQGNQVFVNGKRLDHLHAKDLRKEDEIHLGHKYIDIDREFKKLELNSNSFARNKQSEGMQVNFNDMNNRYIDVSNAKKDEFNNIYVDLDAQYLMAPQPITRDCQIVCLNRFFS
ncbi:hypothetical protein [Lactobacillus helveticus]|uniref:hypothetical protein n=1 Tax=Lactobacillus helveticus TaxID=1587 RepID=UPI000C7CC683|nr:hypothetical protein [Lactobacillus helveticus]AUJ27582.1 hypothetical protein Lh8627_03590 [Lactobacillus helveticus]